MKILKQIFIKKANVKPQTSKTLSVREARDCVKEWLKQKHHKKVSFVEDVENKFIDELLEELEK